MRVKCIAQVHNMHKFIFFGPKQILIQGSSTPKARTLPLSHGASQTIIFGIYCHEKFENVEAAI